MKPEDSASNVDSMSAPRSALAGAHAFSETRSPPPAAVPAQAIGNFYAQLSELARQRQLQHGQLADSLQRVHQTAPDMAYAHRYSHSAARTPTQEKRRSTQHRKEPPYSNEAWGQESKWSGDANHWSQWDSLAGPAPSEAEGSHTAHKQSKKSTKKGKERKPTGTGWADSGDSPWGGGDVWAQEEKAWGTNGWDAKAAGPSKQSKQKETNGWNTSTNGNGWGTAEEDPWANPAPEMVQSTSRGAWDQSEDVETSKADGTKVSLYC